ncbi:MAG: Crp/Fnr family transcriptional regulator [Bacteroidales bacterium]|nr:Crp/Fnr family transcriptional regulator [Bacteroidales bacterium]MDE7465459.1 Crp/Fnr family transcriptional regulator [Muribaculaceae bacterium]
MASMYETIMDLPLFKGVGKDHVSQFVEKTQIHFERYEPGDIIADSKDEVTGLKFVLSGSVVMSSKCLGGKITVESHMKGNIVLGATRLFGLKPMHKRQIKALTPCGVMGFSKEKYIELLRSDRIYLINFANYLSMFIQQREEVTSNMGATGILRVLAEWVITHTLKGCTNINIIGMDYYTELELSQLSELEAEGLIRIESDRIVIPDRQLLIETAQNWRDEDDI